MKLDSIIAISPIDGRYAGKCSELQEVFSEYGLIKRRVLVECAWLEALCDAKDIPECKVLSASERKALRKIAAEFTPADAQRVKDIEKTTNHDVKAVEYFLKEKVAGTSLEKRSEFIHFACTSEDINNMSHALMLRDGKAVLRSAMDEMTAKISATIWLIWMFCGLSGGSALNHLCRFPAANAGSLNMVSTLCGIPLPVIVPKRECLKRYCFPFLVQIQK